jgi:hypothetical protein
MLRKPLVKFPFESRTAMINDRGILLWQVANVNVKEFAVGRDPASPRRAKRKATQRCERYATLFC